MDNYINIHEVLESIGLSISDKTGGQHFPDTISHVTRKQACYIASIPNHPTIRFLNGEIFLKTLSKTEHSLNVKLFV